MNKKNFLLTLAVDLVAVALILSMLLVVRDQTKQAISELQEYTPEIVQLQDELARQNISSYDYDGASAVVKNADSLISRGLFWSQILLPIVLFLILCVSGFLVWQKVVHIPLKMFVLYSLPLYVLVFLLMGEMFNLLSVFLVGEGGFHLVYLLFLCVLLFVYGIVYVTGLSMQKPVKEVFSAVREKWKQVLVWYVLFVLVTMVAVALLLLLFILLWVKSSVWLPILLLVLVVVGRNVVRGRMVKKLAVSR